MVMEKGVKAMADEMVTEEILACVELHNLQSVKLSSYEKRKLKETVERTLRSRNGQLGCQSFDLYAKKIDLYGEGGRVRGKVNARRDVTLKRKVKSLNEKCYVMPQIDGYVAPLIPPVRGLLGLIKDCSHPFEKQLTVSDLKDDQSRFSFSRHDAEQFLVPLVKRMNLKAGVPTTVYDMEGSSFSMTFKTWCDKYYVLTSGWKEFYKSHDLRAVEDFVTVWMFRHGETKKLCFALSSRRRNVTHLIKKIRQS